MPPKTPITKKRQVTDTHKAAMAAGRETGRAVNAYLHALEESRPKRGRKVSKEDLEKRLAAARTETDVAIGTARLLALQLVEDLEDRIKAMTNAGTDTLESVEKAFVKAAKTYSDSKGISYATWRSIGVPADVLKRAGITRSTK